MKQPIQIFNIFFVTLISALSLTAYADAPAPPLQGEINNQTACSITLTNITPSTAAAATRYNGLKSGMIMPGTSGGWFSTMGWTNPPNITAMTIDAVFQPIHTNGLKKLNESNNQAIICTFMLKATASVNQPIVYQSSVSCNNFYFNVQAKENAGSFAFTITKSTSQSSTQKKPICL